MAIYDVSYMVICIERLAFKGCTHESKRNRDHSSAKKTI